jgi:hypothetical protein
VDMFLPGTFYNFCMPQVQWYTNET